MRDLEAQYDESVGTLEADEIAEKLLSNAVVADPFPLYAGLRRRAPVHRSTRHVWLISRYADVAALLRDPRMSSRLPPTPEGTGALSGYDSEAAKVLRDWMVSMDPPDHTRLRSLVNLAFTPRAVASLEPFVQQFVDARIDEILARGETDVVADLAWPLPVAIISELLGVPEADRHIMYESTPDFVAAAIAYFVGTAPTDAGGAAIVRLTEFIRELIAACRAQPADDFLSALICAEDHGDRLTSNELLGMVFMLIVAGHETTAKLTAVGMLELMRNRSQWARLCQEPWLVKPAVEELLRFAGPNHALPRFAAEQIVLGDQRIGPGEPIFLLPASANRDPDKFANPEQLDIGRSPNQHVALGGGLHYCLGAALSRLEIETLLRRLAIRAPGLDLAGEPQWDSLFHPRGLTALPLQLN